MVEIPIEMWGYGKGLPGTVTTSRGELRFIRYDQRDVLAVGQTAIAVLYHPAADDRTGWEIFSKGSRALWRTSVAAYAA